MEYLRNLPLKHAVQLADMISVQPGRVVSMALSRSDHCQMSLFSFGEGESVSEEQYFGDTLYYVLEGEMPLIFGGTEHVLRAGDCMAVPSGTPHAIGGTKAFKLLQITLQ